MERVKLTKKHISSLPYLEKGQKLYWDTEIKGFGLRVGKKVRTFIVQRDINAKAVRYTIGEFGVYSVEQARIVAAEKLVEMAKGINPNKAKTSAKIRGNTLNDILRARCKWVILQFSFKNLLLIFTLVATKSYLSTNLLLIT